MGHRRLLVVLVLSLAAGRGSAMAQHADGAYEAAIVLGLEAASRGDMVMAQDQFEAALRARPGDVTAAFNGGLCLVKLRRFGEAATAFRTALASDPMHAKAAFYLGVALVEEGEADKAVAALRRALELLPGDVDCRYNLARALDLAGHAPEARRELEKLALDAPDDQAVLALLGTFELRQGDLALAARHLEKALALRPDDFVGTYHLAESYAAMRQYDRAAPLFDRALELHADAPKVLLAQGRMRSELSDFIGAIDSFEKAVGIDAGLVDAREGLGHAYLNTGRFEDALAALDEVLAADAGRTQALFEKAVVLTKLPASPDAQRTVARREEAEQAFEEVLRRQPDHVPARYNLALLMGEIGRDDRAEPLLRKVIELDPNHRGATFQLGNLLVRGGRRDEARPVLARFKELSERDDAMETRKSALIVSQGSITSRLRIAADHLAAGELDDAARVAREATQVDAASPAAHSLYARVLVARGELDAALDEARAAERLAPDDAASGKVMAFVLLQRGESREAEERILALLARHDDPELWLNLASVLAVEGKYVASVEACRKALAKEPDAPAGLLALGLALEKAGQKDEARATLTRLLAIEPDNAVARAALARL